jgi:anti-anti-sigma factor
VLDATFEFSGDRLTVYGELDPAGESAFVDYLQKLVEGTSAVITVDLTDVHYISSLYARHLAQAAVDAMQTGRTLVVKASREVHRLMTLGGIDRICELEKVTVG